MAQATLPHHTRPTISTPYSRSLVLSLIPAIDLLPPCLCILVRDEQRDEQRDELRDEQRDELRDEQRDEQRDEHDPFLVL